MKISIPSHLSDSELVAEVTRLAGCEREATAHLVAHLAELDTRRLYLGAGFSSLFAYGTEVLRLSEHAAYHRIAAARAASKFPAILAGLLEGSLNVTTVQLLAPHLTCENSDTLLAAAVRESGAPHRRLTRRPDSLRSESGTPPRSSAPAPTR